MDHVEHLNTIRAHIRQIEAIHGSRRAVEKRIRPERAATLKKQNLGSLQHVDGLPDLPSRLPRPEYAITAGLIGQDDREIEFYAACEQGLLDQVKSFLLSDPSQAVRQYGLEAASFAHQPAVARYLLEQGTMLHDGVFLQSRPDPSGRDVTLFDGDRRDPLPMAQVFLDFGWHPNQLWNGNDALHNRGDHLLLHALTNKPLLALLLSHGADPCLSHLIVGVYNVKPLNRRDGLLLNIAVHRGDPEILALLVEHGADPALSHPLHSLALWRGEGVPFPERRAMAEYILSSNIAAIDDVKSVPFSDQIRAPPRAEEMTPFSYACAAQDWEFAEWLLEQGANSDLLNGKAFEPIVFSRPDHGPSDPVVVRELVDKVKNRQRLDVQART